LVENYTDDIICIEMYFSISKPTDAHLSQV
jgi:hypothetical protein